MELGPKTILLVEDEAIVAMMEKRSLGHEGFNVIHSTTGECAVEIVKANPGNIDLVLMDIDLGPGISGTEAASEILKICDIPLLFLSSHTEPEIVNSTDEITSYGYVVKGSNNTVLLASIKMAFRLFEANRKIHGQEASIREINEKNQKGSREFLESIIEMSPHSAWIADKEGNLIMCNQALLNLFGLKRDDLVGRYNVFSDNIVEEQGCLPAIRQVFERGKSLRIKLCYDAQRLNTVKVVNTAPLYLDISFSCIPDEKGEVKYVIIQHIDITSDKMREERLAGLASELENINEAKDKLISIISHDLRGPLSGFAGLTEEMILNNERYSKEDLLNNLAVMNKAANKTLDLFSSLLNQWPPRPHVKS